MKYFYQRSRGYTGSQDKYIFKITNDTNLTQLQNYSCTFFWNIYE